MNVFVEIGEGIEIEAKDALKFFEEFGKDVEAAFSPQAMLALAVLAGSLAPVVADATAAAASDGLNVPMDVETTELLIQTWPLFMNWVKTLKIRPASTSTTPKGLSS